MNNNKLQKDILRIINNQIVLGNDDTPLRFAPEYAAELICDYIMSNSELEQARAEYSGAPVTEYNSGEIDRIREADQNRSEPMEVIEATVIKEMEYDISVLENEVYTTVKDSRIQNLKQLRTRLINKLRQNLTGRTTPTLPTIQIHAVMNFWMAENNIRKDHLIQLAFASEIPAFIEYYGQRFEHVHKYSIFSFLKDLDEPQRATLIRYIMTEYEGIRPEAVAKYYLPETETV